MSNTDATVGLMTILPVGKVARVGEIGISTIERTFFVTSEEAVAKEVKSTYSVYQGLENGVVRYIGITSRNPAVRYGEHKVAGGAKSLLDFDVIKGATNLTKEQARVMEQNLINQYGLPNLYNKINSIAPSKWSLFGITP